MVRESRIVERIMSYLRARGAFAEKLHGGMLQTTGLPDVVACYRGKFLAIEVKRPGGRATPMQEHILREIRKAGGFAAVATSVQDVATACDLIDSIL